MVVDDGICVGGLVSGELRIVRDGSVCFMGGRECGEGVLYVGVWA